MRSEPISDNEFTRLLRSFAEDAFYFEAQQTYALDYEEADLRQFLAGEPVPPPEVDWWRPWLEQIERLTGDGKRVSRVRVIGDPPTGYQRWQLWSLPWHQRAGEQITYMTRSRAEAVGLPLDCDWWLLDGKRVIRLDYTAEGHLRGKTLITEPGDVARFANWRDLAVRNATTAEALSAA